MRRKSPMKGFTLDHIKNRIKDVFIKRQNGRCGICGVRFSECERTPALDHCHTGGHCRGALCSPCNLGLGCFKDSVELLHSAIGYLESDYYGNPPHPEYDDGVVYTTTSGMTPRTFNYQLWLERQTPRLPN